MVTMLKYKKIFTRNLLIIIAFTAIALFSFHSRVDTLRNYTLNTDEATNMSIAHALNHGRTLYVDVWNHHTNLSVIMFQQFFKVFDSKTAPKVIHLFNIFLVITMIYLSLKISQKTNKSVVYQLSTMLLVAYFFSEIWAKSSHGQLYTSFLSAINFYLLFTLKTHKGKSFATGFLMSMAFFFKQVAIFDLSAFCFILFYQFLKNIDKKQKIISSLAYFALGLIGFATLNLGYTVLKGSFNESFYAFFIDPFIYANTFTARGFSYLSVFGEILSFMGGRYSIIIFMLVLSVLLYLFKKHKGILKNQEQIIVLSIITWVTTIILGIPIIGRFNENYFIQCIVPISLLAPYCIAFLNKYIQIFILVTGIAVFLPIQLKEIDSHKYQFVVSPKELIKFIEKNTTAKDQIYIYDLLFGDVYYLTERFPPVKCYDWYQYYDYQEGNYDANARKRLNEDMISLIANPPKYIFKGDYIKSISPSTYRFLNIEKKILELYKLKEWLTPQIAVYEQK